MMDKTSLLVLDDEMGLFLTSDGIAQRAFHLASPSALDRVKMERSTIYHKGTAFHFM
jgi:hypothetical protein